MFRPKLFPIKVFLVAEIGVAWQGDLEKGKRMIRSAKRAGADAVKFQAFDMRHVGHLTNGEELFKSSVMGDAQQVYATLELRTEAKRLGIEWFATPFSVEAVDYLENVVGVERYKMREKDGRELAEGRTPLLRRILETRKPLMVSVERVPLDQGLIFNPNISWLYCVPKYPPILREIDLSHMDAFQGISCHYPDITVPLAAVLRGARIVEMHVSEFQGAEPDNAVSVDFPTLANFSHQLRVLEEIRFQDEP